MASPRLSAGGASAKHGDHGAVVPAEPGGAGPQILFLAGQSPVEYVAACAGRQHVEVEPDGAALRAGAKTASGVSSGGDGAHAIPRPNYRRARTGTITG
jgi:hypothetical protein